MTIGSADLSQTNERPGILATPRGIARTGFLASVGIALFVLESLVPLPVPFLKLGFANISSVVALELLGGVPMMIVVLIRVLAGSLLTGTLFSPGFILAFTAGLTSACAMAVVHRIGGRLFSAVGISLVGAATHVLTQLAVVRFLFVQHEAVMVLLPVLLLTAVAGGLTVGFIALRLLEALRRAGIA
jgi:heptaprenyl diphosphate synthase